MSSADEQTIQSYQITLDKVVNSFPFITGHEWQQLPRQKQDEYIEKAFRFWRQQGFPYYDFSPDEVQEKFSRLSSSNSPDVFLPGHELQASTVGLELANSFHPQMWAIEFARCRTPVECFENDELLKACLRQALSLWPKRRGASPSVLRDILRTFQHTRRVSNFRPAVAKALYERYSKPGDRVLDFSAGFGGRLLGCLTLEHQYIGYDPCSLQIEGLNKTYRLIKGLRLTRTVAELRQVCAEDAMRSEESATFALIFTSPPYFNRERYSSEPTQSFMRYPVYSEWRERFLHVVISESHRLLKPKGFLILNVADLEGAAIATDTIRFAKGLFRLCITHHLRMSTLPFHRANGAGHYRHEPVFVFQKK